LKGALGDVRVRRALSMALDRQGIIDSVYRGAALMPRWLSNPGTFGYGKSVFDAAYAKAPVMTQNIDAAKKLVQQAGATGKTITTTRPSSRPWSRPGAPPTRTSEPR